MRTLVLLVSMLAGLSACKDDDTVDTQDTQDTDNTNDTDDTDLPDECPEGFDAGRYRVTSFVLNEQDDGADLDGDGTPDNNLPTALEPIDVFMGDDMDLSREGLNARIAESIALNDLVILIDASCSEGVLSFDILGGSYDPDTATLTASAEDVSELEGAFTAEVSYSASADSMAIPATFWPDQPPLLVPMEQTTASGDLAVEATTGALVGIVPVDRLVEDVIDPLIPEDGWDGQSKEEILALIGDMAELEHISDMELEDGSRGVSAAFTYEAYPATW